MSEINELARKQALKVLAEYKPVPTSLISYQSSGRVIVLGDEVSLLHCKEFSAPLEMIAVVMSDSNAELSAMRVVKRAGRDVVIEGYLGNFNVSLTNKRGESEIIQADLVLDLNDNPLIKLDIPPHGSFHESINKQNRQSVEKQLLDMTGQFEKPKYLNYEGSICAHGVHGKTVCTNCIDACPTGAISSLIESITVDPYLCQGGGTCATVCPSGALQYLYPGLSDSGNSLRLMLQRYREQGGSDAIIMFHAEEDFPPSILDRNPAVIPVKVEELASVGMELCLSALVYGATQVILLSGEMPELSLKQIQGQIDWLHDLLKGLGLNPQLVTLQQVANEFHLLDTTWVVKPALYAMPDNKRNAVFQAVDHFYQQISKTKEMVALPVGAPFGSAMIDEGRCTLCMSCVGACPGRALQDGSNRELPDIFFIESNCLQCGSCTRTCPEQAISITPRFVFDGEKRNKSRVLIQDKPFACISCGKAFAPSSVIHSMRHKLKDHYMFKTSRALDRLKMCNDCRVADIVQDPEALNGNFDPLSSDSAKRIS